MVLIVAESKSSNRPSSRAAAGRRYVVACRVLIKYRFSSWGSCRIVEIAEQSHAESNNKGEVCRDTSGQPPSRFVVAEMDVLLRRFEA